MRVGVVSYHVTLFVLPSYQMRIVVDHLPDHKERSLHIVTLQNVQDLRRICWIRSVVEGESYDLSTGRRWSLRVCSAGAQRQEDGECHHQPQPKSLPHDSLGVYISATPLPLPSHTMVVSYSYE